MAQLTRSLALLLTLGFLPSVAGAQQELFVLGRFNKIWRVDGYDTASPMLVEITTDSVKTPAPTPTENCTGESGRKTARSAWAASTAA